MAWLLREAGTLAGRTVIVNMSGRGDKDLGILESERPTAEATDGPTGGALGGRSPARDKDAGHQAGL